MNRVVSSQETEPLRYNIHLFKKIYHEKLVHTVVEAKKSHDFSLQTRAQQSRWGSPSSNLRPKKQGRQCYKFQFKFKAWRTGGLMVKGKRRWMFQCREGLIFLLPLCLFGPQQIGRSPPAWWGASFYQCKCWSLLDTPSQKQPQIIFYQLSRQFCAQSSWTKH